MASSKGRYQRPGSSQESVRSKICPQQSNREGYGSSGDRGRESGRIRAGRSGARRKLAGLPVARTELVFLLSEEVRSQASQVRNARAKINELLDAIDTDTGDVSRFIRGR